MYKILDLFAGAGGLSLGFEMTEQFEVAAIVENNKNAAKTYIKNHPGLKNYNDILSVDFKKIIDENGKIDVVIGGPPCQGFSNANRQRRQLINGSNELVKRYVKAIEELQPKAFVMENVKTIASDKHSFCLTYKDENYIKTVLELEIKEKDIVLYEGKHADDICKLCDEYSAEEMCVLNEEELYIVYNLYKKRGQLKEHLKKASAAKKVQNVIEHMQEKKEMPKWYNDSTLQACEVLKKIVSSPDNIDMMEVENIKNFWDIQRFFQGKKELDDKEAIYERIVDDKSITIRMHTYIVIDFIKSAFKHLGYDINGGILNAASFGVPQTRERYILIGIKQGQAKGEIELPIPLINDPKDYITVKEAIEDLAEYDPTIEGMDEIQKRSHLPIIDSYYKKLIISESEKKIFNHVCTGTRETALERFKMIGQGKNFHSLPDELKSTYENPARTQNTIYKRLAYDQPSDTVVNVRKSMWIHPELDRAISAREAARLQGFPDDYIFFGTKDSVYQQIGNAVPPLLGRAVAEKVLQLVGYNGKYETLKEVYDSNKKG